MGTWFWSQHWPNKCRPGFHFCSQAHLCCIEPLVGWPVPSQHKHRWDLEQKFKFIREKQGCGPETGKGCQSQSWCTAEVTKCSIKDHRVYSEETYLCLLSAWIASPAAFCFYFDGEVGLNSYLVRQALCWLVSKEIFGPYFLALIIVMILKVSFLEFSSWQKDVKRQVTKSLTVECVCVCI